MEIIVTVDKDETTLSNGCAKVGKDGVIDEEASEHGQFLPDASDTTDKDDTGTCSRLLSDKEVRHKYLHTGCVALALMASGWRMSMTGPSFPDLRLIINEDLSRASWIISAIALGGLVGSFIAGSLYDRLNKYLVFITLTLTLAAGSVATPWCSTFVAMVAIHVLNGACAWGIDTIAAADVVFVWREKSAPFLQAVNFAYSVGAMLSPVTAEPFFAIRIHHTPVVTNGTDVPSRHILTLNNTEMNTYTTYAYVQANESVFVDDNMTININDESKDPPCTYGETNIHMAFLIAGIISFLVCVTFVCQYCCLGNVHKRQNITCLQETTTMHFPLSKSWRVVFVVLLSAVVSTYCTSERLFYSYLMTFLVERLHWDKSAGAGATTVFWVAFTLGRLLSVFIVRRLKITAVFVAFLGILLTGECVLLVAVRTDYAYLVWLACGLHGFGMSALFASSVNWISSRVCRYTGTVSGIVFSIVILGAIVYPLVVGNVMSSVSYDWFIYLEIILTSFMAVLLILAEILYCFLTKDSGENIVSK